MSGVQLLSAAVDVMRDGHYTLVDGLYVRTLLLEGARTNAWSHSEDFSNAAWSKSGCSVTANAGRAPDGALTADRLVESALNEAHYLSRSTGAMSDGAALAASVYAKADVRNWLYVVTALKDGTTPHSWVNLATGVTGTASGSHSIRVVALSNGWYRVEVVVTVGTGGATPSVFFGVASADNTTAYAGDGTSGLLLFGAQIEIGAAYASTYVATTTGTATRSADSFALPFPYTPQALTVYGQYVDRGLLYTTGHVFAITSAAGGTPSLACASNGSGQLTLTHHNGTSSVSASVACGTAGDVVEVRAVLAANGAVTIGVAVNEGVETVSAASGALAPAAAWAAETLYLNSLGTSAHGFAAYRAIVAARGERTLTAMRSL